ncbi:MAG: DUF3299 domain-containing protein [Aestuariibacter sp.]
MIRTYFATLLFLVCSSVVAEPLELYWEDLIPTDYQPLESTPDVDHQKSMAQLHPDAPVKQSLNGKEVKIPGFVVPLEGDDESLTEFLLVPYFGACIHVPPPPSNQIVYVKFETGVPVDNLYDAVWVTGTLSTQAWKGDIASVGYSLKGAAVSPFE